MSNDVLEKAGRFFLRTKLYWGLIVLLLVGIVTSPITSKGVNIFLSPGNLADVLRQVANNGIVAVGMTLVILTGGIDLSVGSVLALGTVVCAALLTEPGWTSSAIIAVPLLIAVTFVLVAWLSLALATTMKPAATATAAATPGRSPATLVIALAIGIAAAALVGAWAVTQVPQKFGVIGVLVATPAVGLCVGALTGLIIAKTKMQPFIVSLAMMVGILGVARLVAGQDTAVHPVYTGENATADFEMLRALIFRILPVPGLFFLAAVAVFYIVLKRSTFGRYIYAIGGNEQATRLSGINVDRVKIAVYALCGMLSCLAGVLYVAQYRQGKPDAGLGLELDAIAAVVIGGTNLMGGKGSMVGTLVGVLIFGFLSNILQLNNIDSNTQLVLKGLIILGAVLLQEGNLRVLAWRAGNAVRCWRGATDRADARLEEKRSTGSG
jgi:simple sugar transport system permease protein